MADRPVRPSRFASPSAPRPPGVDKGRGAQTTGPPRSRASGMSPPYKKNEPIEFAVTAIADDVAEVPSGPAAPPGDLSDTAPPGALSDTADPAAEGQPISVISSQAPAPAADSAEQPDSGAAVAGVVAGVLILLIAAALAVLARKRQAARVSDGDIIRRKKEPSASRPAKPSFHLHKFGTVRGGAKPTSAEPKPAAPSAPAAPQHVLVREASVRTYRTASVADAPEGLLPDTDFPEFFTPSPAPPSHLHTRGSPRSRHPSRLDLE